MESMKNYATHDFRWNNKDGSKLTWRETLVAMCKNFGTFCGRWHSNEFWKTALTESETMTEEQAEAKVRQIEREADACLEQWKMYQ